MTSKHPELDMARKQAVAHAHGLRAQLRHGLELLTDDHPLCQWTGKLLPLEDVDYAEHIPHGTNNGWQAHRRHRIPMCDPCRLAHAQYNADLKHRKAS